MSLFEYVKTEIVIEKQLLDMFLVNIVICEHRKDENMFYSSNKMYKQMGYIFNNSFHLLKNYMKCINCHSNYENDKQCSYCKYKYTDYKNCFFLNSKNVLPRNEYNILKNLYNLDYIYNYYYDQRNSMSRFLKLEIIEKAFHPDRIEKILSLTNDNWFNLENYI